MLAIQHHIVKSGEAHDLDQCRVSRETLHTQRDLTVIDHFFDSVFLVHHSASLSFPCVVPSRTSHLWVCRRVSKAGARSELHRSTAYEAGVRNHLMEGVK